ncbi:ventrally expressed dharma/bozozok antagonist isoform X2 [Boleophthalmus pectinirostris]|nr:ventrally expressed dharma/bozozok antagonist isoform X2 [Boleophthalmus pectinirostris]
MNPLLVEQTQKACLDSTADREQKRENRKAALILNIAVPLCYPVLSIKPPTVLRKMEQSSAVGLKRRLLGRRPRTAFTAEQINSLEQAFKRNAYLGTQNKAELCKKLNLSDKQIRNWFQNRRMKLKRTVQDALAHACQANVAPHFMHYPELQSYRASPYPRFHSAGQDSSLTVGPYVQPQGLQYTPALNAGMYQYSSLPSVMLPSSAAPVMGSYPSYSPYY